MNDIDASVTVKGPYTVLRETAKMRSWFSIVQSDGVELRHLDPPQTERDFDEAELLAKRLNDAYFVGRESLIKTLGLDIER